MRIDSTSPLRPASPKRDGKTGSGSASDFASAVSSEHPASAPAAARPVVSVEGLFQLQELPDALAERRRAVQRGSTLLDRLDDIRLALLGGGLSRGRISELQRVAESERGRVDDPRLLAVLDEIDLRAQVELAKLSQVA
ncbi:MAG TPA: flagellar assembly protein FliX [Stellaceae bacterium]|nr:flagellar assembly protein FliX [Stellaceae bacterium]